MNFIYILKQSTSGRAKLSRAQLDQLYVLLRQTASEG